MSPTRSMEKLIQPPVFTVVFSVDVQFLIKINMPTVVMECACGVTGWQGFIILLLRPTQILVLDLSALKGIAS